MSELGEVPKQDAPQPSAPNAEPVEAQPEPEPAGEDADLPGSAELLAQFQACAGNHACADCGRPEPSWASSNTGALVCIHCCGVHRLIGTDNSAPLSVKLDSWSKDLIANMLKGNAVVIAVLEAELPADLKITPDSDRGQVEDFIWSKYGAKSFLAGGSKTLEKMPAERAGDSRNRSTSNIGVLVYAGILFITCKKATQLKDKDFFGKSDPYLVARVGEAPQQAVTKVIQDNLDPEWNETLQLNVPDLEDLLFVECYDSDTMSDVGKAEPKNREGDEILGIACLSLTQGAHEDWVPGIPLTGLQDGSEKDIICRLVDPSAKKKKDADGGMLMLSLKYMALDQ